MASRKKFSFEFLEKRLLLSFKPYVFLPRHVVVKEDSEAFIPINVWNYKNKTDITLELKTSGGQLNLKNIVGVSVLKNTNDITIRGPQNSINNTLKFLIYRPIKDSNKTETITVSASSGGRESIYKTNIRITPINDAPAIHVDSAMFLNKNYVDWKNQVFSDIDSKNVKICLTTSSGLIQIFDPAVKNLGNKVELKGDINKVNQLFSTYGKIKLSPINNNNFDLKIQISDGSLQTEKVVTILQKENLIDNAVNGVLSRIKDKDPSISKPIFFVKDHQNGVYVRNTNGWAYDIDLTCISPWNSAGGDYLAGTLISPRHIVFATHYQIPIGATIRFITKDNVVVERTLINKTSQQYTGRYYPDITVGLLDSDVPSTIKFSKILPDNWSMYIDNSKINIYTNPGNQIPCLALDQEEKGLVTGLFNLNCEGYSLFDSFSNNPYKQFFENIITGDSGNPVFMIIDNQLVLITVWTFGGGGSGTFITNQKSFINKAMNELGGGYQLTEMDLSKFAKII